MRLAHFQIIFMQSQQQMLGPVLNSYIFSIIKAFITGIVKIFLGKSGKFLVQKLNVVYNKNFSSTDKCLFQVDTNR